MGTFLEKEAHMPKESDFRWELSVAAEELLNAHNAFIKETNPLTIAAVEEAKARVAAAVAVAKEQREAEEKIQSSQFL